MKIVKNYLVNENNYIVAENVRTIVNENGLNEIVADGLHNWTVDENGNSIKTVECIVTDDGDCSIVK